MPARLFKRRASLAIMGVPLRGAMPTRLNAGYKRALMNQAYNESGLSEIQSWLLENGRGFLDDLAARQRARLSQTQQALLEQQIAWRHRSRFRFPQPNLWLWSDCSLAQSSDWLSATFKAALFPQDQLVVDGCCGAGVDAVALSLRGPVIAIDSNPWLASLAQNNAAAHGLQISAFAELLTVESLRGARWLHVDPDRRFDQAKTLKADEFSPSVDELAELLTHVDGGIIKIAPSTEFSERTANWVGQRCRRAWIGSFGECRQQLLLVGDILKQDLLQRICSRSQLESNDARIAVVLTASEQQSEGTDRGNVRPSTEVFQWQAFASTGGSLDAGPEPTDEIGRYVFDLHATLHAAELQQAWAAENDLAAITDVRGYFTGDEALASSLAQCFEVIDVVPWDDRQIRKWLRGRDVGNVEVKCRLTKLDASSFQRRYSGEKGNPLTLLVTRVGERVRAIACNRLLN
jgi:THUMP domain-like